MISRNEALKILGIAQRTLNVLRKSKKLVGSGRGQDWCVSEDELNEYMQHRKKRKTIKTNQTDIVRIKTEKEILEDMFIRGKL